MRYIMHPLYLTIFGMTWGIWDLERGDWLRRPGAKRDGRWMTYSAEQAAEQATRLNASRP